MARPTAEKGDAPPVHVEVDIPHEEDLKASIDENGHMVYASIMANHKPDKFGLGYLRLYVICLLIFLCSTMNGKQPVTVVSLVEELTEVRDKLRLRCVFDVFNQCPSKLHKILRAACKGKCQHWDCVCHFCCELRLPSLVNIETTYAYSNV